LNPGETCYSVLIASGASVVRYDYSQDAWEGPPVNAIAWWTSQIPEPTAKKVNWAPNDVMLHYFEQLDGQAGKEDVRYVLALLMTRRRVVRLEESKTDDQGREELVLFCPRNESQYHVAVVTPSEQRAAEIQHELTQLLQSGSA
jgi:hypothetical protein